MKVRAIRDCYIDRIRREGEEFDYDGPENRNLHPMAGAKWPSKAKSAAPAKPAAASDAKPAAPAAGESEPAK